MNDFTFKLDIVKALALVKKGDRVVVGYASTFDIDTDNTQITKQALEGAKDDLLTYSTVLFNHDMNRPIGKVIETSVDDVGLLVKVILSKEEDEIWKKIEEGIINKFSIKGRALDLSPTEGENQVLQINKIELFEVSLVSVPANKEAGTISHWIAKSLNENKEKVVETSEEKRTNMKDLIEKLKVILSKEDFEEAKKELDSIIKTVEKEEDVLEKLQIVSGKLSGEDKEVVDSAVDILKASRNKYKNAEYKEEDELLATKKYDLADESEARPVFQLNNKDEEINLEEGNKFQKQVLKFGKWFHWDADGGVLNITDEVVDNIVKNFKKSVIEHVYVPVTHTTDPVMNAGEVIELKKTENGLDAVIEIKDETILEKIKKGLIKCVSASIDPNYRIKTSNKFAGPTLLHTALVSEPFIKGMGNFIPLSEDFVGRNVIMLEDKEPSFTEIMKALKDSFEKNDEKYAGSDEVAEEFAKLRTEIGLVKQIEEAKNVEETIVADEVIPEVVSEVVPTTEDEETDIEKVAKEVEEDIEKKKHDHKEGDHCMTSDGKKGKYTTDGETMICKSLSNEELKEMTKSAFSSCMSKEMKAGKTMAEASKTCKAETRKSIDDLFSEETSSKVEVKSETEITAPQVDLAEVEREYEGYLKAGKIVPAQKDAFVQLMTSGKVLELGDNKVGVSELIKTFMESQKVIDFEEDGVPVTEEPIKEKKDEDLSDVPADAKEFFGRMGLSKPEDIKKSWANLKEMKDEDDNEKSSLF